MKIFRIEIDKDRIFGLDILRSLAILFVVVEHGKYLLPKKMRQINDLIVFDGVSIFFVLSGFLIGGILLRTLENRGMSVGVLMDFWIRRWFRTIPNYFLILTLLVTLQILFGSGFFSGSFYQYFYFSQCLISPHPAFFPEAWSLCVEEWFYLVTPIAIFIVAFAANGKHRIGIASTAAFIIILVTFFRFYKFTIVPIENFHDWDKLFRKQVITRLDSLMFGVVGAYLNFYHRDLWLKRKHITFACGLSLMLATKYIFPMISSETGVYNTVFSFSLVSLSTLLVLPFLNSIKAGKGLIAKLFTYISLISYSMYLLNLSIVQYWIIGKIPWTFFISNSYLLVITKYLFYWISVLSLSILLYKYFEIKMTKCRDMFNPIRNKLTVSKKN
ncbi:acyltransferase family protein [Flavihumibacter solisilvae]|uniref:Acyltransferase 3 domain-containing protein n=1 Tax=Flavihumibacter solisilvae TaxID=1349421 RepID=A0A0C1IKE5_9BACT|nr:acyltransferase [Flavihumibacter solisilvae]KIC94650.1 hypothetical protein OI18_11225 [Flavihumibacter solisilvae]